LLLLLIFCAATLRHGVLDRALALRGGLRLHARGGGGAAQGDVREDARSPRSTRCALGTGMRTNTGIRRTGREPTASKTLVRTTRNLHLNIRRSRRRRQKTNNANHLTFFTHTKTTRTIWHYASKTTHTCITKHFFSSYQSPRRSFPPTRLQLSRSCSTPACRSCCILSAFLSSTFTCSPPLSSRIVTTFAPLGVLDSASRGTLAPPRWLTLSITHSCRGGMTPCAPRTGETHAAKTNLDTSISRVPGGWIFYREPRLRMTWLQRDGQRH
jgi:hypothetical protein